MPAEPAEDPSVRRPQERAQRRGGDRRVGRPQLQTAVVPVTGWQRDGGQHQVDDGRGGRGGRHVRADQRHRPAGNGRVLAVLYRRGRRVHHAAGRRRVRAGRHHRAAQEPTGNGWVSSGFIVRGCQSTGNAH